MQPRKDPFAMTEETYISLTVAELSACKHIGYEYLHETIFLVKHKTSHSSELAVFFD